MEAQQGKELRIGNYINYKDENHLFEVVAIDDLGVRVKDEEQITWIEYDCFDPIPLTEKHLIGFGFKEDEFGNFENESRLILFKKEDYYYFIVQWGSSVIGAETKNVHQLQNLYFALTGEELKTN